MADAVFQIAEPGQGGLASACSTRAVGIDLGTTNSLIAVCRDDGRPLCIPDDDGHTLLPSAVHYAEDGAVAVGAHARELASRHPERTFLSIKRFMGRGPADVRAAGLLARHEMVDDADGVLRFGLPGGRAVTPMEVSAEILKALRARAEWQLGPLAGAVITVPAYFDDAQRQATRDAGRLAGLEVLRLINEPTAAALAYGLDKQASGRFAVFDLGGGTFDVSILALEDGVFEVRSTGGDTALGGDDFDRAIADHALAAWRIADPSPQFARSLLAAARAAREELTSAQSAELAVDPAGRLALTRQEMERLVRPVLERCRKSVERALRDAGVKAADLDGVILVGGPTRMPIVRAFVKELFGREPLADIDPDEVVALGAAIQADVLGGAEARHDVLLLDVVPLSLGLETMGGIVERLIPRNTTVPCGAAQTFTTYADNQTGFDLHVVQGEREMVSECRSLARFTLKGIPPMPAGMARLQVTFTVDADGLLKVHAREETTGHETQVVVKPSYGLTDDEVERMLLSSYEHAEEDVRARLLAEQRIEAERIKQATLGAMKDSPELLADGDRTAIDRALAALATAHAGSDSNAIRAAVEGLDAASKAFAARRMNRAIERGLAGRRADDVEAKAESDIARHGEVHGHHR